MSVQIKLEAISVQVDLERKAAIIETTLDSIAEATETMEEHNALKPMTSRDLQTELVKLVASDMTIRQCLDLLTDRLVNFEGARHEVESIDAIVGAVRILGDIAPDCPEAMEAIHRIRAISGNALTGAAEARR